MSNVRALGLSQTQSPVYDGWWRREVERMTDSHWSNVSPSKWDKGELEVSGCEENTPVSSMSAFWDRHPSGFQLDFVTLNIFTKVFSMCWPPF